MIDPTGRYIIDPMLQPGSGSPDWVASPQRSFRLPAQVTLGMSASYQLNGRSSRQYEFGDDAIATATVSRPAWGPLTPSLQVKAWHKGRSTYRGDDVGSTGATIVYLTPGARVGVASRTTAYGFLQLPVYRNVNEQQLTPRYSLLIGVSHSF